MSDLDLLVMDVLEEDVPLRLDVQPDWQDVLARAGVARAANGHVRPGDISAGRHRAAGSWSADRRPRSRHFAVALAAAAAAAALLAFATPVGGAIARGLGDFSAWLTGAPGEPAEPADQEAFERANNRSWAGFPDGPQLRTLIERQFEGRGYELFGFRSGGSLCLRLVARGLSGSPVLSCAPIRELRDAVAPALVVLADHGFGRRTVIAAGQDYVAPESSATFGIVADGVEAVELVTDDGTRRAIVGSNAFLSVDARPTLGERVRKVFAITSAGRRIEVPFVSAPFGTWDTPTVPDAKPAGPSNVERRVRGGEVGWIERREQRGQAPPSDAPYMHGPMGGGLEFARLIAPDPQSHMRLLIGVGTLKRYGAPAGKEAVCFFLVAGGSAGGGCQPLDGLFPRGPFIWSQSLIGGGHQFETVSGLASDEVARMEIFFATGERHPIPLRDNAFIVQAARAKYPIRLVAYDATGQSIGIETIAGDAASDSGPRPVGPWRTLLTVRDGDGQVARLRVARSSEGGICHEYRLPSGAGGGGCIREDPKRPKLALALMGGSGWLTGTVVPEVAEIELRFADGSIGRLVPTDGFVLAPVPSTHGRELRTVIGFDSSGAQIARQQFRLPDVLGTP